jgi:hypothetical protein
MHRHSRVEGASGFPTRSAGSNQRRIRQSVPSAERQGTGVLRGKRAKHDKERKYFARKKAGHG